MRMSITELDDYVTTILALKEEYRRDITIRLGLDAHKVQMLDFQKPLAKATELVERYHLHVIDDVPLINPFHTKNTCPAG